MGLRGPKPTGKARTSTERVRRHRQLRRQVLTPADDAAERQAAIRALDQVLTDARELLSQSPPDPGNRPLVLWRLGIEQCIALIERHRDEVREFIANP
jgi:hypothetical protein